jgi:hypothetical protein
VGVLRICRSYVISAAVSVWGTCGACGCWGGGTGGCCVVMLSCKTKLLAACGWWWVVCCGGVVYCWNWGVDCGR